MKNFRLIIEAIDPVNNKKLIWHEIIESDSLVELFSRLLISQAQMMEIRKEQKERHKIVFNGDDDIPF